MARSRRVDSSEGWRSWGAEWAIEQIASVASMLDVDREVADAVVVLAGDDGPADERLRELELLLKRVWPVVDELLAEMVVQVREYGEGGEIGAVMDAMAAGRLARRPVKPVESWKNNGASAPGGTNDAHKL